MTKHEPRGNRRPAALRRFLLGDLSAVETERIEAGALEDDDLFDQLNAAEEELIDDYALGRLSRNETRRFEEHFASGGGHPRRQRLRQRVAFARDLSQLARQHRVAQDSVRRGGFSLRAFFASLAPPMRPVLAAAAAALVAVCSWLAWQTISLRTQLGAEQQAVLAGERQIEQLRSEAETAQRRSSASDPRLAEELAAARQQLNDLATRDAQLRTELDAIRQAVAAQTKATQPPSIARSASFILSVASAVRGVETAQRLRIPAGLDHVELQVDLTGDTNFTSYRVALRSIAGDEIWSRAGLRPLAATWGNGLELRLPAASLVPGDYELMVFGETAGELEELAFIDFRVDSTEP